MPNNITDADREALKPCPFCGGEGLVHRMSLMTKFFTVSCKRCDASPRSGFPADTEAEAFTAWNTRQPPTGMVLVPESVVEAAQEARDALLKLPSSAPRNGQDGRLWQRIYEIRDRFDQAFQGIARPE